MSKASQVLGIFSVVLIATGLSIVTGSVGMILALLSRGNGQLDYKAKTGLITSGIGIVGGILVTFIALNSLFQGDWSHPINKVNTLYETYMNDMGLSEGDYSL